MLKKYEDELMERFKHYYSLYVSFEAPNKDGYALGRAHEIIHILRTLYNYSDSEISNIENEIIQLCNGHNIFF